QFVQDGTSALARLLEPEQLQAQLLRHCPHYRHRLYPPLATLGLFVQQVLGADHGCRDAVAQGLSARLAQGLSPCSPNTGPYCKARQRLPAALLAELCQMLGQRLCQAQVEAWRWRGREIKLIDGTTVSMPDTVANQAQYPQNGRQKPGLGFALMRIVAVISLGCGAVLGWAQGACKGKNTGEPSLLAQLHGALEPGDVVLMDRCYAGYFTLAHLQGLQVDFVSRQQARRSTDFRRGKRLGKKDHVVWLERPRRSAQMHQRDYDALPLRIELRETRVGGWVLITSLLDAGRVSREEVSRLYSLRWHVELDLRAIKAVMQMDTLRCKSPAMAVKEVAAHLLAYNLARSVMAQAAHGARVRPRELSFKGALQQLRAFSPVLLGCGAHAIGQLHALLLTTIGRVLCPKRPGRVEPRAVKRRPKNMRSLTQPRAL
ncbi:IS4 family transposase, partial [Polaromonas sp. CG_9.11]|uniref:IS4 family transposase n=1 Tax=Polaromonas sp. CG_9.11 TaxID=2787730 RepID=UPI0018C92618